MLVYEERLAMPAIDLLFDELTQLKIMKNILRMRLSCNLARDLEKTSYQQ